MKLKEREIQREEVLFRGEPGAGAIEFALPFFEGLYNREIVFEGVSDNDKKLQFDDEALEIAQALMAGELHKPDKRIKRCKYCGHFYQDKTRPNNSVVCSPECREARKVIERKKKRHKKNPPKPTYKEKYYFTSPDGYDCWVNEEVMLYYFREYAHETPFNDEKIEQIAAAKQRAVAMGGRKKPNYTVNYSGDEEGHTDHKVTLRMGKRETDREPGEPEISRMESPEEYLLEKYGEHKLRMETKRAQFHRKNRRV